MNWEQFQAARANAAVRGKWVELIRNLTPGVPLCVQTADNHAARGHARDRIRKMARSVNIEVLTLIHEDKLYVSRPPAKPVVATADATPPSQMRRVS